MISAKSKIPIKTSNPVAAFNQLEGHPFHVHRPHGFDLARQQSQACREIASVLVQAETDGSTDSIADNPSSPNSTAEIQTLSQSKQLVGHLQERERLLAEQDADYHVRVWNWQQQVARTHQELERRRVDLDDQETQLRALQFELLQLQTELIDSQLATREIVNELQLPGRESSAVLLLKSELNQRFDHVMVTWNRFSAEMQELAQSISEHADDLIN